MRAVLFALALTAGPAVAFLVDEPSFAAGAVPVHSTISLLVPCLAILLDRDRHTGSIAASAMAAGVVGNVATAAATGDWDMRVALGGLVVQALAAVIGVAFGRWVPGPLLACVAVTVCPIGVWVLLGFLGAPTLQAWLTPFGVVSDLLAATSHTSVWWRASILGLVSVAVAWRRSRLT